MEVVEARERHHPRGPGTLLSKMKVYAADYLHMYTLCTLFSSIGGFLFGFDTGTLGCRCHNSLFHWTGNVVLLGSIGPITVMPQFQRAFAPISPTLHGLIVSSILITGSSFSFLAGPISDHISRTYTFALGGAIFAAGSALAASAHSLTQLFIGRCVAGAGEGLFLSTITVYTCEIAPTAIRGTLACFTQLFVTIGIASG